MKTLLRIALLSFIIHPALWAQETTIKLPTVNNTSSFNVTNSSDAVRLKLNADAGFYLGGTNGTGAIPVTGAGTRLMWYPAKVAFRAGRIDGTQWDDANIGSMSIATGFSTTASGNSSTAMGYKTTASGNVSTAMGSYVSTNGMLGSFIMGDYSTTTVTNCDAEHQMVMRFTGGYKLLGGGTLQNAGRIESTTGGFKFPDGTTQTTAASTGFWSGSGNDISNTNTGKVGINKTTPTAQLHVSGTEGLLAEGTYGSGTALNLGTGTRMHWYPQKAAFRAGYVDGTQWDDANIGAYSTALGYCTTASGYYSMAMGANITASGDYSTAMGEGTTASGENSTAMGRYTTAEGFSSIAMNGQTTASGMYSIAMGMSTTASGNYSTAMGSVSTAQAYASVAIGRYNLGTGSTSSWVSTDPIFEIGIGINSFNKENALTVLKNGKVGIITATPTAQLHVGGTEGLLAEGTYGSGTTLNLGTGARLHWYPKKAAFRVGYLEGTMWDDTNVGNCSVAMGRNTTASGPHSTAIGYFTTASGNFSTSMGSVSTAQAYASVAIGRYNDVTGSTSSWVSSDPLFVCGNGSSSSSRSNALILLKNGDLTIAGDLTENSDIRLKENITPLNSVLESLEQITPIHYHFKNRQTHPSDRQIGLIAQEIEPLFPELVSEDSNGMLSVNYSKMATVLLKAVQEQQQIILQMEKRIDDLENEK